MPHGLLYKGGTAKYVQWTCTKGHFSALGSTSHTGAPWRPEQPISFLASEAKQRLMTVKYGRDSTISRGRRQYGEKYWNPI